jgi:hypothetical protein
MKKMTLCCAILLALAAACASRTRGGNAKPPTMTCEEFLSLSDSLKPRAVAWMDGYSAGKTKLAVGEVDVDRQMDSLIVLCQQTPKQSFWDRIRAKLPGGRKKIQPTKMTCQEFIDLDQTAQPEAAYWLDGYDAATRTDVSVAGEVDLERDVNVVLVECKQAPKESLWQKIKSKF